MRAAFSKVEFEAEIASRFGSACKPHEKRLAEVIPSGNCEVDSFIGGLPRGAMAEVFGPASSGRTSFMLSALAHATRHEEICALVDTNNVFDPKSAAQAEMNFERLLWIRCAHNLEHAFKATDLLLQGGGFGVVMLDLGNVPAKSATRIISSWWYRFRRTLEATPTAMVVIAEESCVRSCATLGLELRGETCLWSSSNEQPASKLKGSFGNAFNKTRELNLSRHPFSSVLTSSVATLRPVRSAPLPHTNLLQGLCFQVECQRPLHHTSREREVVAKAPR
jgi:hypothetical protein